MPRIWILPLLASIACADEDVCSEAVDHAQACGLPATSGACDAEAAQEIVAMSCDDLERAAAAGKSDSTACWALSWVGLCSYRACSVDLDFDGTSDLVDAAGACSLGVLYWCDGADLGRWDCIGEGLVCRDIGSVESPFKTCVQGGGGSGSWIQAP